MSGMTGGNPAFDPNAIEVETTIYGPEVVSDEVMDVKDLTKGMRLAVERSDGRRDFFRIDEVTEVSPGQFTMDVTPDP